MDDAGAALRGIAADMRPDTAGFGLWNFRRSLEFRQTIIALAILTSKPRPPSAVPASSGVAGISCRVRLQKCCGAVKQREMLEHRGFLEGQRWKRADRKVKAFSLYAGTAGGVI
jgi:hypothetical protein